MSPRVHPTAIVEDRVEIGCGTAIWDNVHIRGPARIGNNCIIGEKTYIAYGVEIGNQVKINAFVYVCNGVTIENGVMISAGAIFTNDPFPRATTPDLAELKVSEPDENTLPTHVREGSTVGARAVIGPGLQLGRFSMIGMGSVVTRSVSDFHLVVGNPARPVAFLCRCGEPFHRQVQSLPPSLPISSCGQCGLRYSVQDGRVIEHDAPVAFPTVS